MSVCVHIVDGPVERQPEPDRATLSDAGAVLTFLGVVRGLEEGAPLESIDYQTYDPMAQRELERLVNETAIQFGLLAISLVHSRGVVPIGQPSLLIEIRSAHRREGLDAMDSLIDHLKRDVPIWKRPIFAEPTRPAPGREPHDA
ncbi:MAG: molybdopterin synthase catalytic subunit [Phycisphaerales bacterium]|jgi:molybdopterin synthase catalytic subunit